MSQRLPAVPAPAPPPASPQLCPPLPRDRSPVREGSPPRPPHLEWAAMARLTQSGVPCPSEPSARGPLRPRRALHRPQSSATLLSGRPRRADAQLPAAASSAPRPQRRLRPPEPRLAPSLTDIRAPGAAGRTAPRSSPGTGAAHRPGALSGHF